MKENSSPSIWAIVTIIVAIVGCVGTIAAAAIGIVPDLFEQPLPTEVAILTIPTSATEELSSTPPSPTNENFPEQENALGLTNTPTKVPIIPTILPTNTLAPSPTLDNRLFWDDFESVPKPDWVFKGNYNLVNGKLSTSDDIQASVGDRSWDNYRITLDEISARYVRGASNFKLRVRVQDDENYMEWVCSNFADNRRCYWQVITNGNQHTISNSEHPYPKNVTIEVEGPEYRVFDLDNEELLVRLIDQTYTAGGIMIVTYNTPDFSLEGIEVYPLP